MKLFKQHISNLKDEELIPLILKKKEEAFNEIYERYSKKLHYFFYIKFDYNEDFANDLLQDLFIKLIENAEKFDNSLSFSSWFYTMANNNCKNEYKKPINNIKKVTETEIEREKENYDLVIFEKDNDLLFHSQFNLALEKELRKLKETHRVTFILKHKENLTIKEIAKIMDCSEGTTKSRLFYTINKLSKSLSSFNKKD